MFGPSPKQDAWARKHPELELRTESCGDTGDVAWIEWVC